MASLTTSPAELLAQLQQIEIPTSYVVIAVTALMVIFAIKEKLSMKNIGGKIPGGYSLPFVGDLFKMILHPWEYYQNQFELAGHVNEGKPGMSWASIGTKFFLFTRDTDLTRKVFTNQTESLRLFLCLNAEKLLGKYEIAFLHGQEHIEIKKQLNPLLNSKACASYLPIMAKIMTKYVLEWKNIKGQFVAREKCRDLNVYTSTHVFLGPRLSDAERKEIADLYLVMNESTLAMPVYFPGTTLWKAVQARKKLVNIICSKMDDARARMRAGEKPESMLDIWVKNMVNPEAGQEPVPPVSDGHMATTILSFMFASQDALTCGLTWSMCVLGERPDVVAKIQEEQRLYRPTGNEPWTLELLGKMEYLNHVVMECLRWRPPAPFVPHICKDDFQISTDMVVPKGSVIFPSIVEACHEGYPNPDEFDPDRWTEERGEEIKYKKHWIVFGTGAHLCLGKQYAINQLSIFFAIVAMNFPFKRVITPQSHDIYYSPAICPVDNCIVQPL